MGVRIITFDDLYSFKRQLQIDERSQATISKYLHDVKCFWAYTANQPITKEIVLEYKAMLSKKYALSSANSMLAALNSFFGFMAWNDCCVRQFKIQKKLFCSEEKELSKEEYRRLVQTAIENGNEQLALILQTICGTGIRISELQQITVEAVRKGEAVVSCKNKSRTVFIVRDLQKKLLSFIKKNKILSGSIFVTKSKKPVSRFFVWREMKMLCDSANVSESKVFPHNLRHLFARAFYSVEKDLARLADILGHLSVNTTRIYIISTGTEHRRRMEQMHLII